MDVARSNPTGSIYFYMTAMLLAYLTYEAYINFVGERVAPEEWSNEREHFSKGAYRGLEGKLRKICESCGIAEIRRGERPFQTIASLGKLRDYLAHGKPDRYELSVTHHADAKLPLFGYSRLEKRVTPGKAERAVEDVETFIEWLHARVRQHVTDDVWFGEKGLGGLTQHSSGSTSFAP